MKLTPIDRSFFDRPVLEVARDLLGQLLVRVTGDRDAPCVGRIVETEAYAGRIDPASHSYRGPTPRTQTMFGPVGHAYVYFTYGNHYCMNAVVGPRALAGAVLIRALEPLTGIEAMREQRARRTRAIELQARLRAGLADHELTSGPGKLTASLRIDRALDGVDATRRGVLYFATAAGVKQILWTPRIGLGDNAAAPWSWRCFDPSSPHVTRVPASWPRVTRPTPTLSEVARATRAPRQRRST